MQIALAHTRQICAVIVCDILTFRNRNLPNYSKECTKSNSITQISRFGFAGNINLFQFRSLAHATSKVQSIGCSMIPSLHTVLLFSEWKRQRGPSERLSLVFDTKASFLRVLQTNLFHTKDYICVSSRNRAKISYPVLFLSLESFTR